MSETLLIVAGVVVFFMTVIGVLIYFYSVLIGLDSSGDPATVPETQPGTAEDHG